MNKKVTMLVSSLEHGGAEKVCVSLCNELVNINYEIVIWIIKGKDTHLTQQLDKRVTVFQLNKKNIKNALIALFMQFYKQKPEKIMVFHMEPAIVSIVLKKLFFHKTKIIVRSINTLSHEFNDKQEKFLKRFTLPLIKFVLPYSDRIIAQSTGMYRDLVRLIKTKNQKIITVFNPAFNISENSIDNTTVAKYENEFLFVGRLSKQKGLVNLLIAFKKASVNNPNMHLTLVGDGYGSQMGMLKEKVKELDMSAIVTFEGYQENVLPYYNRAKATLLTSFYEGFPNVLVESIGVGTPVISFDLPSGPEDIIEPGINGILVPHLNVDEFSNAILDIVNGNIKFNRDEIIKSSKKFSLEQIVKKYDQVFSEV